MRTFLALLALAVAPLAQQSVTFNGRIVELGAPSFCPGFQYGVESMPVLLQGANLGDFNFQVVEITGKIASSVCPIVIVDVTDIQPATGTLSACGTPAIGCPMRFHVGPPTISTNALFASLGPPSFFNLGDFGVLALTPPLVLLGSAGAGGVIDINMPGNAALVGAEILFQGYHQEIGPITGPGVLTQPLAISVLPPSVLCIDPSTCQ